MGGEWLLLSVSSLFNKVFRGCCYVLILSIWRQRITASGLEAVLITFTAYSFPLVVRAACTDISSATDETLITSMNLCLPQEILASRLATDNFISSACLVFPSWFQLPYFPIQQRGISTRQCEMGERLSRQVHTAGRATCSPAQRPDMGTGFPSWCCMEEWGLAHEDVDTRQVGAWLFSPTQKRWAESPSWPWKHNWGWTVNVQTKVSYHLTPMVLRSAFIFLASCALCIPRYCCNF